MGRLDWKRGRFDSDYETNEIHGGLRGHQNSQVGDEIRYYRFERELSQVHDIYDEGTGAGRVYRPYVDVPVLHVTHDEGRVLDRDGLGFYFNDNLYVTASYDQFTRTGLTEADLKHETYLKDRIAYDGRLFRITNMHILGQIQQRDLIVSIEATHIKPDELVSDPQFRDFLT